MLAKFWSAAAIATISANATWASSPQVVTDIVPVYAIVAQVMEGVGVPELLIEPSASPHDFSLRPSHARALQTADAVFGVSEDLTPWLVESLETLAKDAQIVFLAETPETLLLEARDDGGDTQVHGEDHGHDHGDHDPHSWLDPVNVALWNSEIVRVLSEIDPENAQKYAANAARFNGELTGLVEDVQVQMAAVRGQSYVVYHDAFQYFEHRFNVHSVGAISNSEASDPGPRRLNEIKELVEISDVSCLAAEPGYQKGIVAAIAPNRELHVAVLDPIGAQLSLDKNLYVNAIQAIAGTLSGCLSH